MTLTTLNLPTEIPWRRLCVSDDMIARGPRDLPGKWRSSIAVFKYVPDEEYQTYEGREISYLKVAVTVCGYQARDKEVEGQISWGKLSTTDIANIDKLLNHYHPCTGALVQVAVTPEIGGRGMEPGDFPYFMDFQPKKRELYEVATDTKESMSRSLEGLNIRKASGTTESLETINIDQGSSASGEVFWGAVKLAGSNSGQWGTRRVASDEQALARTTDQSRERREGQSHTTQLSQVYTLFDSYHQGTNRGVFFLQPRPYTLEEPSGFVTGPRKVEGIQELFLVVNRPKDGPDYSVSVRLDTAHFVDVPVLGYAYLDVTLKGAVTATVPGFDDPDAEEIDNPVPGARMIHCKEKIFEDVQPWMAPPGYVLESVTLGPKVGDVSYSREQETGSVSLYCRARGRVCIERAGAGHGNATDDMPLPQFDESAYSMGEVAIRARSESATEVVGSRKILMVTTRGLDCGMRAQELPRKDGVVWTGAASSLATTQAKEAGTAGDKGAMAPPGTMSAREANALGDALRTQMQEIAQQPYDRGTLPYIETDLFADLLKSVRATATGESRRLRQPAVRFVCTDVAGRLKQSLGGSADDLTLQQLTDFDPEALGRLTGLATDVARRLRLDLIGLPLADSEVEALRAAPADARPTIGAPLLVGLQVREARQVLARAGLALGATAEADSPMPAGSIIGQDPPPGAPVEREAAISLTLASGLTVRVPQVVGLGLLEAACRLREAGLKREPVVEGPTGAMMRVAGIEPAPGTLVTPCAPVRLGLEPNQ